MKFPHLFAVPDDVDASQKRLLLLLGAAFFIGQYDMTLLTLALPDVQATFSIAEDRLGNMIAAARVGAIPAIVLALMADRMGRRRILLATLVGLSIFATASGFAQTATQFVMFQFAARMFATLDEILAITLALEMLPAGRRGWGVGFLAAMGGLGSGLGAFLYGQVEAVPGGWRGLYVLGGAALLYVAWMRRTLPESVMFAASSDTRAGTGLLRPLREIFFSHRRSLAAVALIAGFFWFPASASIYFMSKYLQELHQYSPGEVSTLFLVAGGAAIFGNIMAGKVSDRVGRRPTIAVVVVVNSAAFITFYNSGGLVLPIAWVLALFTYFAGEVVIGAFSGELFPTSCRSTAAMLRMISGVCAAALGLIAEGLLYNVLGSHAAALSLLCLVSLLALPAIKWLLRETAHAPLQ